VALSAKHRLDRAIKAATTVQAKYDIWTNFNSGTSHICASANVEKVKEIQSYLQSTLNRIIDLKVPLGKADGEALATISARSGINALVQDR